MLNFFPMALRGDVKSMNLAGVLQDLAANEKTGSFTLRRDDRVLHLWFEKGVLRLAGMGKGEGPSVLNGLLALERIPHEDLPEPSRRRRGEAGILRRLGRKHGISRDDRREALAHQMTEHVCEAFHWDDAAFEFRECDPDDESFNASQLDLEVRLPVEGLVMEALRRRDEW